MNHERPESGVSEEDYKRFNDWVLEHSGIATVWPKTFGMLALDYATKYERAKQAELVEENERLKSQLKDYCNDCQHPTVNERQAAELSKLRQENERYKEALQCMMNVEHHGDFMNAFFDLKDQVKAALQGE